MVHKFHFHFEHPIASSEGRILSEPRRVARGSWLLEELIEFMGSEEQVDQVDAILDFLYFCWGNFVEIGLDDASFLDIEMQNIKGPPATLEFSHRVSFATRASESVFNFIRSDTKGGQCDFTTDAARTMLRCLKTMNTDPSGLMDVVQQSNMGKLWPDGNPRFADDGKVMKPVTWEAPELELERVLNKRAKDWMKEHADEDIPF
jgi:predicted HAD superfamily Cof-like phosphohydrolase